MKNFSIFILFLIYTVIVFFISNYLLLLLLAIINLILMYVLKINYIKALKNLSYISFIVILAFLINMLMASLNDALLMAIRLILVCNSTYIFSKILSPVELSQSISILFYPLKIFKINPQDIGLIVTVAISFLPILKETFAQNMLALKAKGRRVRINNISLSLKPILISTLKRVGEIEYALKAKGYEGN